MTLIGILWHGSYSLAPDRFNPSAGFIDCPMELFHLRFRRIYFQCILSSASSLLLQSPQHSFSVWFKCSPSTTVIQCVWNFAYLVLPLVSAAPLPSTISIFRKYSGHALRFKSRLFLFWFPHHIFQVRFKFSQDIHVGVYLLSCI